MARRRSTRRLRRAGVAAYATPHAGRAGPYLDVQLPDRPTDRLFVESAAVERAASVLADLDRDAAAQDDEAGPSRDEVTSQVDATFAEIVAHYTREPADAPPDDHGEGRVVAQPQPVLPGVGWDDLLAGTSASTPPPELEDEDEERLRPAASRPGADRDADPALRLACRPGCAGGRRAVPPGVLPAGRVDRAPRRRRLPRRARHAVRDPRRRVPRRGRARPRGSRLESPRTRPWPAAGRPPTPDEEHHVTASDVVQLSGHVLDSGAMGRTFDDILELGGDYVVERFDIGKTHADESSVRLRVSAHDAEEHLAQLIMRIQAHGANLVDPGEALLRTVEADGVFPEDFYSTTNLDTEVRVDGRWLRVRNPEMDCGLIVERRRAVTTVPVSDVTRRIDRSSAARPASRSSSSPSRRTPPEESTFEFMNSVVSSEKPQALQVRQIAQQMRDVKAAGQKILWVGRPGRRAHRRGTGHVRPRRRRLSSTSCSRATPWRRTTSSPRSTAPHSVSTSPRGQVSCTATSTTSGPSTGSGGAARSPAPWSRGSSPPASCTRWCATPSRSSWSGSVRDDGPLPDVYTDVIEGQRAMRAALPGRRLRDHGRDHAARDRDRQHPARQRSRWSASTSTRRRSPSSPTAGRRRPRAW